MFMSVEEAARRIGIGRSLAYELCRAHLDGRSGGLRCIRLGRRVLVPRWAVDELGLADNLGERSEGPGEGQ